MSASSTAPIVVVLGGCNGAGKTTIAQDVLLEGLHVDEFLNADMIARGLSPFHPESVALSAGQLLLRRMDELIQARISFGVESTLAGRSLAGRLRAMVKLGYDVHLTFVYLESVELAVGRVRSRVAQGGHRVPEATIRRRYFEGMRNFFTIYRPLATTWQVYDNSPGRNPKLVAIGKGPLVDKVPIPETWAKLQSQAGVA
jgi:predicted ABC-type ATPase